DVSLILHIDRSGNVSASAFPIYNDDVSDEARCLRIGSGEPIILPERLDGVWGDAELSKPPEVVHFHPNSETSIWATNAYFPLPPNSDANGFFPVPRNKAMTVLFQSGLSRPTYTRAALKMTVSFYPLLGPRSFLVFLDKQLEFKSLE